MTGVDPSAGPAADAGKTEADGDDLSSEPEEKPDEEKKDEEKENEAETGGTDAPEETQQEQQPAKSAGGGGRVVCIDAGHQRKQNSAQEPVGPGSSSTKMKVTSGTAGTTTGVPEYQLTLAVALKLQSVLQQRGYTVVMCRSSHDVDISNVERAQVANNNGAGAFIRIHADGSDNASAAGASTLA
ncbi:MAG: N-acetylmuramoyl-L-alanine amidase, partial [Lachnospiraceae bacterium]|nr:N-acetylmuramoyl-L-alanine amidase [Lachnospiraceae bacterium]